MDGPKPIAYSPFGLAEVRDRATLAGFEITPSTPQALRDRIHADIALYAPLVAEGRIAQI